MANDTEAEIREIKLKIDNLLQAVSYRHVPQAVTITYLKELQKLRQRLHDLGGETED